MERKVSCKLTVFYSQRKSSQYRYRKKKIKKLHLFFKESFHLRVIFEMQLAIQISIIQTIHLTFHVFSNTWSCVWQMDLLRTVWKKPEANVSLLFFCRENMCSICPVEHEMSAGWERVYVTSSTTSDIIECFQLQACFKH